MADRFVGCVRDTYKIKYANGITYISDWIGGKVAMGTTSQRIDRSYLIVVNSDNKVVRKEETKK